MSDELPGGWAGVPLPEIAVLNMGQSPPSNTYNTEGRGLPFFQGKAEFGEIYPTPEKYCSAPTKVAEADDILISVRAPVGPTNLCRERSCIGRGLAAVRPRGEIPTRYLLFYFRSIEAWLATQGTGSTFTAISKSDLEQLQIRLAPLAEQRRIVAKLEKLLGRVDACQQRLARIPVLLKRFRQAVLAVACSGRLTAEWRSADVGSDTESGLPESWELVKLGELAHSIRGGSTQVPTNDESPYPILRSSSVRPFTVNYTDVRYLSAEQSERNENFVEEGDLLITRLSGSIDYVGNCALVRSLDGRRIQYPDRLFRCRLKVPTEAPYVEFFFAGPSMRKQIGNASRSAAGHQRISISDLQGFTIARPPIEEQREVVRRVEALFALADEIDARFAKTRAYVDKLTASLLAKAFRGELVPTEVELARREGRDYEDAQVLLERLSARSDGAKPARVKRWPGREHLHHHRTIRNRKR